MKHSQPEQVIRRFGNYVPARMKSLLRRVGLDCRRFHVYGVGLPRSGTTTLSRLFEKNFLACHERDSFELIQFLTEFPPQCNDDHFVNSTEGLRKLLRSRDARLGLELDSSHVYLYFLKELVQIFPDAKFVFTTRDCFSWLNSIINKELDSTANYWKSFETFRYLGTKSRDTLRFSPPEAGLEKLGRFPVSNYFDYWKRHHEMVLEAVPTDRLLIVKIAELNHRLDDLASFVGVGINSLDNKRLYSNRLKCRPYDTFNNLPAEFLDARMSESCSILMEKFFPEITSVKDVLR